VREEEGGRLGSVGQIGGMGRLAAGLGGPEAEKNPFRIKIGFLNLKALEICTRRLRGILTQGFFLNSSRILKVF
jgi:hypothetical protein